MTKGSSSSRCSYPNTARYIDLFFSLSRTLLPYVRNVAVYTAVEKSCEIPFVAPLVAWTTHWIVSPVIGTIIRKSNQLTNDSLIEGLIEHLGTNLHVYLHVKSIAISTNILILLISCLIYSSSSFGLHMSDNYGMKIISEYIINRMKDWLEALSPSYTSETSLYLGSVPLYAKKIIIARDGTKIQC